jgi:hypothetical protein
MSGDPDCSGAVNTLDGVALLQWLAAGLPPECLHAANVDCSAAADTADLLLIMRYSGGLPVDLPPGCPAIGLPIEPN